MSKLTQRLILFGTPLFVGILNLFHPVHFQPTGIYEDIHNVVGWWITLHILNLFGFALLGFAAYLLVKDGQGKAATIAKIALAIFVPTYTGFDSVIGIGTGVLVQYANGVPLEQLKILDPAINSFWTNNVAMLLAIVGSMAWGISMTMAAVTFTEPKRRLVVLILGLLGGGISGWGNSASTFGTLPWWIAVVVVSVICFLVARPSLPASLLILSGILFGTTHVVPYGPLGMACLGAAIALLAFAPAKARIPQTMRAASS